MRVWVVRTTDTTMLGGTDLGSSVHRTYEGAIRTAMGSLQGYLSEFTTASLAELMTRGNVKSTANLTCYGYDGQNGVEITLWSHKVSNGDFANDPMGYDAWEISVDDNRSWYRAEVLPQEVEE